MAVMRIDEGARFESKLIPSNVGGNGCREFMPQESSRIFWITEASLEKLVMRLVYGFVGHAAELITETKRKKCRVISVKTPSFQFSGLKRKILRGFTAKAQRPLRGAEDETLRVVEGLKVG